MKFTLQKLVFSLLFCIAFFTVKAGKVYDFNATCQQAYKEITSLRLASGEKLIAQAKAENPDNLIPYFLNSYIDFFILFFNEAPAELKVREPHFDNYLDILDDGPTSSPFYNYCRAVVLIQAACVEIKFGERWSAGWDFPPWPLSPVQEYLGASVTVTTPVAAVSVPVKSIPTVLPPV